MNRTRRPDDRSAVCGSDALMPEADAKDRDRRAPAANDADRDPCLSGRTRSGRQDDADRGDACPRTDHERELPWLEADPALLAADTVTMAVQVLGKLRATIEVPAGAAEAEILAAAEAEENVRRAIGDRPVRKRIHVPGRVVNFVV